MQLLVTTRSSVWPRYWVAKGVKEKTGGEVVKGGEAQGLDDDRDFGVEEVKTANIVVD